MNNTSLVLLQNNQLVTTSLVIAERLDIQHKNILHNIDKFSKELQTINPLAFETRKGEPLPQGGYSKSTRYALLTEEQAAFVITLSRNTPKVVEFKLALTKAFFEAREALNKIKVENKVEHQSYLKIFKDFCLQHNYSSEELKMFDYLREQALKQGYAIACQKFKGQRTLGEGEIAIPKDSAKRLYLFLDNLSDKYQEIQNTVIAMDKCSSIIQHISNNMFSTRESMKEILFKNL